MAAPAWGSTAIAGGYMVGLEPSCTAVFRGDAPELFPDDQDVLRLLATAAAGALLRRRLTRRPFAP